MSKSEHPETWRARLRRAVDATGRTHSYIARQAGVAPETLSRILTHENSRPSFDVVVRIAHAAGESVGYILREEDFPYNAEERAALVAAAVIVLHREGWSIIGP